MLSSNAVLSTKEPSSHVIIVKALRSLYSRVSSMVPIEIHWIRGHSGVGGNERVDRIAKRYAQLSVGQISVKPCLELFNFNYNVVSWPQGLLACEEVFVTKLSKAVAVASGAVLAPVDLRPERSKTPSRHIASETRRSSRWLAVRARLSSHCLSLL